MINFHYFLLDLWFCLTLAFTYLISLSKFLKFLSALAYWKSLPIVNIMLLVVKTFDWSQTWKGGNYCLWVTYFSKASTFLQVFVYIVSSNGLELNPHTVVQTKHSPVCQLLSRTDPLFDPHCIHAKICHPMKNWTLCERAITWMNKCCWKLSKSSRNTEI